MILAKRKQIMAFSTYPCSHSKRKRLHILNIIPYVRSKRRSIDVCDLEIQLVRSVQERTINIGDSRELQITNSDSGFIDSATQPTPRQIAWHFNYYVASGAIWETAKIRRQSVYDTETTKKTNPFSH